MISLTITVIYILYNNTIFEYNLRAMKQQIKIYLLFIFLAFSTVGISQTHEFSALLGFSSYEGDVNKRDIFLTKESHFSFGLQYKKYVTKNIYASANFHYGRISGDDRNFEDRAQWPQVLNFTSPLTELSIQFEWLLNGREVMYVYDIEGNRHKWNAIDSTATVYSKSGVKLDRFGNFFADRDNEGNLRVKDPDGNVTIYSRNFEILEEIYPKRFTPYVLVGVGFSFFSPEAEGLYDSGDVIDPETLPGVYKNTHFTVPIGGGLRYDFSPRHAISLEAAYRYPFTDYIDGISDSRDPDDNDWYLLAGLRYSYKMGFNKKYLHEDLELMEQFRKN